MLPTIDFNNIDDVIDYIDISIIENHNNEIIAEQHNNIENGLAKFIIQAPRNWDKASVINTAGNYVAVEGECILVFNSLGIGSITLTDNKWNEWTIVNRTNENKQLVGDISSYRTVLGTIKNYFSPHRAVTIAEGKDCIWYEISNASADPVELICNLFGVGTISITGDELDGSNQYFNSGLADELTVFYNGLPGYFILGSQWDYIKDADNATIGIRILRGSYTNEDVFIIAPNPRCGAGGGEGGVIHAPIQFTIGSGNLYVPNNGDSSYDNPTLIGNDRYTIYSSTVANFLKQGVNFYYNPTGGFSLIGNVFIYGDDYTLTFYA